jgi:predicted amidophosphoribosyltransferase
MAIKIIGNWINGFVLDLHTVNSVYAGDNQFGHPWFKTVRTEIGELVFKLKYRNDEDAVSKLVCKIKETFKGLETFDNIIPIPPSDISRPKQPVLLVGKALSDEIGVPILFDALNKTKPTSQVKNEQNKNKRLELLRDSMELNPKTKLSGKKILLIDDVYDSGSTLTVATEVLYTKGHAQTVYVLALTKTRGNK